MVWASFFPAIRRFALFQKMQGGGAFNPWRAEPSIGLPLGTLAEGAPDSFGLSTRLSRGVA